MNWIGQMKIDRAHTWSILDSLLEKYILEKVKSIESEICSSWRDVQLLIQIVTEPLAWHGLVIQSCLRSCLPSGKKKKKSGSVYHSSSSLVHKITNSVQHLSNIIEEIMKWIREWKNTPEDKNVEYIISSFRNNYEQNDGSGRIFCILDLFFSSKEGGVELGDRISQSLESWSPADMARKMLTVKHKVLMEFSKICESKLKSLRSMKQQMAQL